MLTMTHDFQDDFCCIHIFNSFIFHGAFKVLRISPIEGTVTFRACHKLCNSKNRLSRLDDNVNNEIKFIMTLYISFFYIFSAYQDWE